MLCIISIEVVDGVVSIRFITPYLTDFFFLHNSLKAGETRY